MSDCTPVCSCFRLPTQQDFAGAHCPRAAAARLDRQGWRRAEEFRHWSRDRSGRLRPPHHRWRFGA